MMSLKIFFFVLRPSESDVLATEKALQVFKTLRLVLYVALYYLYWLYVALLISLYMSISCHLISRKTFMVSHTPTRDLI